MKKNWVRKKINYRRATVTLGILFIFVYMHSYYYIGDFLYDKYNGKQDNN